MRVAIIGGGAAGMSCASRIKALKPDAQVSVFEKTSFVSHAPCGIPYFLAGLSKLSDLMHYPPSFFVRERGIDLHLNSEVIEIENGELRVREERGERKYFWDFLVFATGALPKVPLVEGVELEGVLFIHHPSEAERAAREVERAEKIAVIGAGYLGVELAEALSSRGKKVSVIEMFDHPLPDFDREVVEPLEREMRRRVQLFTSERVLAIEGDERAEKVITERREIPADLVLFATGVRPNVQLAERAGVKIGETGAIEVDEHMRTSIEDIYAAGDCCETRNLVTGKRSYMPLATIANKMGYVAGVNIAGGNLRFPGAAGTRITKFHEVQIGRTGLSEREALEEGFEVQSAFIKAPSRAKYYPEGRSIYLKLICERDSRRILGAQISGFESVLARLNSVAVALSARFTVRDLFFADFPYAPPLSTVWDPLVIASRRLGIEK
ncbi:MAG: CoA-dependent sulfur oxidoreductase [Archaeoglobi archaeon]|nr:CoA-dependent sulfur oxidoreductase [Archaeoglobi archaeon]